MTISSVSGDLGALAGQRVLVTGGSGWLATYCIADLLGHGATVRTTVRDLAQAPAVPKAVGELTAVHENLEVVEADLEDDAGWREAAEGCTSALHTASPFPSARPRSDEELVRPAREGTLRVLRAAREAGLSRVVMTSSVAAVAYGRARGDRADDQRTLSEADWSDTTDRRDISPYERSKTLAERAAWDLVRREPGGPELVTICPAIILGPLVGRARSTSLQVVSTLIGGRTPGLVPFGWAVVDVRDVARLHLLALLSPDAAGQRYIAAGPFLWMAEIASVLRERVPEVASKVPTRTLPSAVVRLAALTDPALRGRLHELGKVRRVSSRKAEQELGWSMRPTADTITDTARSLLAAQAEHR